MRKVICLSVITVAFGVTMPVQGVEVSANVSQTVQMYSGNGKIIFPPDEKFKISSEHSSEASGVRIYSGNVVINFKGGRIESDTITLKKQKEGMSLLEAKKFVFIHSGDK